MLLDSYYSRSPQLYELMLKTQAMCLVVRNSSRMIAILNRPINVVISARMKMTEGSPLTMDKLPAERSDIDEMRLEIKKALGQIAWNQQVGVMRLLKYQISKYPTALIPFYLLYAVNKGILVTFCCLMDVGGVRVGRVLPCFSPLGSLLSGEHNVTSGPQRLPILPAF